MISIGSGLKTHASQRSRNNWLTVEMEDGAPANYWANRKAPPTVACTGRGDGERSHGLKLNYSAMPYHEGMTAASGRPTREGDPERAAVAKLIYAQRTPLQLRQSSTSFGGAIVVKLDHQARTRGTSSRERPSKHRLGKVGARATISLLKGIRLCRP
jgi:hypothetical protein